MLKSTLLASLLTFGLVQAQYLPDSKGSQYVHSNDTIRLELAEEQNNLLYGPAGSTPSFVFVLYNNGPQGHFSIRHFSDDNFIGRLPIAVKQQGFYLSKGQQQTIKVSGFEVPQRPEGSRIKYTIRAIRDSGKAKRSAQSLDIEKILKNRGTSDNIGGTGGGSIGSIILDKNHPSYKREASLTIEYQILNEMDDNKSPSAKVSYVAQSKDEACPKDPSTANCDETWWANFEIMDEDSGLHEIEVVKSGEIHSNRPLFFRYDNFPIGSDKEYKCSVQASCCIEKVMLRVTDVAGNQQEKMAESTGTGSPMSETLFWILIGAGALVAVIIVVIIIFVCYRKKYTPVSSNA